jgi:hypothetical protein
MSIKIKEEEEEKEEQEKVKFGLGIYAKHSDFLIHTLSHTATTPHQPRAASLYFFFSFFLIFVYGYNLLWRYEMNAGKKRAGRFNLERMRKKKERKNWKLKNKK